MKAVFKRHPRMTSVVICFLAISGAACFWYLEEQGNFHPVTHGEAYRSAQLDRDELERYIGEFGIRSVINLRGCNAGETWYQEEIQACRTMRVRHFDLELSAQKAPLPREVQLLVHIFDTAPRPVLIHCQGGADRSGLVAALWKIVVDDVPKSVARNQLSLRYGHLPVGPARVLDYFLDVWGGDTGCLASRFGI